MVIILNYPPPTEGLHHVEPNVSAYFQKNPLGKGTLYIAESIFCWIANSGEGFSLRYEDIFIHAVSKDRVNFQDDCLFLMIKGDINLNPEDAHQEEIAGALSNLQVEDEKNEDADDIDETIDEDLEETSDMHFVPDNLNMLQVMFQALSDCQALNPDPEGQSDEEDNAAFDFPFPVHIANGSADVDHGAEGDQAEYVEEEMDNDQFEDAEQ